VNKFNEQNSKLRNTGLIAEK